MDLLATNLLARAFYADLFDMLSRPGFARCARPSAATAPANRTRRITRSIAALVLALGCVGLAGCADRSPMPSVEIPAPNPPATPTVTTPGAEPSGDAVSESPIRMIVGDQIIWGRLWDNPAARSLLDQLPLTLEFSDFGGQEVTAEPPLPLTMEGMPAGESAPAGTIGYYAPGGVVVLYYTDVGRYNGIVRIGQMDGDVSVLEGWTGPRAVTIERAG